MHPYVKGTVLHLDYTPVDSEDDDAIPIKAIIRDAFTPFTKSQALIVDFPGCPSNLPHSAILKMYDRRYIDDRERYRHPWSPSREHAAISRWRAMAAANIAEDWPDGSMDEWDDGFWEAYFENTINTFYLTETEAYQNLKSFQGVSVPRVYGTVEWEFEVDGIHESHQSVPGIVLEHIHGSTLEELQDPGIMTKHVQAVASLFEAVDQFMRYGVLHYDIRPANIILVLKPQPRLVIIDFGRSFLRDTDVSDARWQEMAQRIDVRDLRFALTECNVRDYTPYKPAQPHTLVPRDKYPQVRSERWWRRWFVPVNPRDLPEGITGSGPWYRMKPDVYEWMLRRNPQDPRYWSTPRPDSPVWTAL